ncbi:hypothetical protein HMPREF0204_10324 [Chryseobacterium gleum ATCC 35910]|uniref:Uncharacterized protein n=1 Tax=Chryseobacterium gleum ATCC 35910 TaxID=525257 RepID=A0ABN0AWQ4_CHRGE|nr:hypothetical protein HMPREF0204_10324 [Chryseobacterium gleum ATCC 35910]
MLIYKKLNETFSENSTFFKMEQKKCRQNLFVKKNKVPLSPFIFTFY